MEETNNRVQSKLESYQELFDSNQRLISLGKRVDTLAKQYLNNKKKKPLMDELFKLVLVENSKIKKTVTHLQKASDTGGTYSTPPLATIMLVAIKIG